MGELNVLVLVAVKLYCSLWMTLQKPYVEMYM